MLTAAETAAKKQDVALRTPALHCRSLSPELSRPTEGDGRRSQLAHADGRRRTDADGSLLSEHVNGAPGAVGRFARTAMSLARGGGYRGEGDCGSSNSR